MTSYTTYKGATLPAVGSDSGLWGPELNGALSTFDSAIGGDSSITLSNVNVTLSAEQAGSAILRLTGTLSGPVQITTSCQGFQVIENLTSGAYAVTITNGAGSPFTLPQGVASLVIFDSTNGSRFGHQEFQAGTKTVFYQASAPLYWTQDTSHNDIALRVVSGTGGVASTGGQAFSTAVATGTVDGHALSTAEMPTHNHTAHVSDPQHSHSYSLIAMTGGGATYPAGAGTGSANDKTTASASTGITVSIDDAGSGIAHPHTFTSSAIGLNHLDMIMCVRD